MSLTPKERYTELDAALRKLIAEGKCDSDEADAVREQMDGPWWEMTQAERREYDEKFLEAPDAKTHVQADAPEAGSGGEPEDRTSTASDAARQEGEGCDGREEAG